MAEYTDKQRIARAFLRESQKTIDHQRRVQEGYIRTAIEYRLPVDEIARITGRDEDECRQLVKAGGGAV